jgi:cytochrome P450
MIETETAGDERILAPANVPPERIVDFDLYAPPGLDQSFDEPWERLHTAGRSRRGLVWTPRNEGHWIVTTGAMIAEVLSDHERFSNRVIFVPKSTGEAHNMLPTNIDVPDHAAYRRLLNNGLSPRAVRDLRDTIRATCVALIDGFAADGSCDFVKQYADQLPIRVFMSLVDLPVADAPKLKVWSDAILHTSESMNYAEARQALEAYLTPFIEARLGGGGTDMLSDMINGRIEERSLTREEMFKFCVQLMIAGLDTVVNMLCFIFLFLANNPNHRRQLVDDPDLIPIALEELFRRFSLVCTAREVKADIEYAGVQLKKGDMVLAPTPIASIDEDFFTNPHEVDLNRRPRQHLLFGRGNHICPGATLARAEMTITLEEWLKRMPDFSLEDETRLVFGSGIVGTIARLPLVWNTDN